MPRQAAQYDTQLVGVAKLIVAIARQHQDAKRVDPAAKQSEDIERRLIRPMKVLDNEHRRRTVCHLLGERGNHLVRKTAAVHKLLEPSTREVRDINKRAERSRGEQPLTRAPQDPGWRRLLLAEPPHERGLPNASLTPDEHKPTLPPAYHRRQQIAQSRQMMIALKQLQRHGARDRR